MRSFALILLFFCLTGLSQASERGIHWGALPVFNYNSDQGANVGGIAQRFNYGEDLGVPFRDLLTLQSTFAERGPKVVYAAFEKIGLEQNHPRYRLEFFASQNDFQNYYGLGNNAPRLPVLENQAFYLYSVKQISLEVSTRQATKLTPGLDAQIGISPQGVIQAAHSGVSKFQEDFASQNSHFYSTRFFSRLILERRNSEFIPSQGYYATGGLLIAPGLLSTRDTWIRADFDYRRYDSILPERRLWLATQWKYAVSSSQAPLFERARFGGRTTLRGLPLNRFADAQAMLARTELRSVNVKAQLFDLPLKFGEGIFAEVGRVGNSLARLATESTHLTWGFSIFGSYFTDDFLGGADFGFSEDGLHFYFNLGHAF